MDEFLACSDLCEENGFDRPAGWFRTLSAHGGRAFVVVERGWEYNDEIDQPNTFGEPDRVFFDRATAEEVAAARNAAVFRRERVSRFCYGIEEISDLTVAELNEQIRAILDQQPMTWGDPEIDAAADQDMLDWPDLADATEEQVRRIANLFTLKFFYVVETTFAG